MPKPRRRRPRHDFASAPDSTSNDSLGNDSLENDNLGNAENETAEAKGGVGARRGKAQREAAPRPALQKLAPTKLRIIAGELRGRRIQYNGDPAIRPMKERTRESVFSLLGGYLHNTFAVDLFGGTGILAIESVSRGADGGVIFELSRPAVSTIVETLKLLKLEHLIEVHNIDTLRWMRSIESNVRSWPKVPWMIYCCPPYRMWTEHKERLLQGIAELFAVSPPGSKLVCETEHDFDIAAELANLDWDIRTYQPAFIAIATRPDDTAAADRAESDDADAEDDADTNDTTAPA